MFNILNDYGRPVFDPLPEALSLSFANCLACVLIDKDTLESYLLLVDIALFFCNQNKTQLLRFGFQTLTRLTVGKIEEGEEEAKIKASSNSKYSNEEQQRADIIQYLKENH